MDSPPPPLPLPHDSSPNAAIPHLGAEVAQQKRPRSPPLAFEPTPNDALAAPLSPPKDYLVESLAVSPSMDKRTPLSDDERKLQIIVEKQARLIESLHETFADERKIWGLERERLHQRIARLEGLLKHGDGHSPAKSPVLSPTTLSSFTSPQSRPVGKLPSIAEDENFMPLSQRRDNAPAAIDLSQPSGGTRRRSSGERKGSVNFAPDESPTAIRVEEISNPATKPLSPPPFNYRMEAGHTPLKAPRPPTPPPQNSLAIDGIEDTPTRNNTHINNAYLTQCHDEDGDNELSGPLNLPELPHAPGDGNFSLEMLSKRLQNLSEHPDESDAKPLVFKQKSPGLASPAGEREEESNCSPSTNKIPPIEDPLTAPPTRISDTALLSPLSQQISQEHEEKVQQEFESGGIRLKKKASVNFGAPFGSLGVMRKTS